VKLIYILEDRFYLHGRYRMILDQTKFEVKPFSDYNDFIKETTKRLPDLFILDYDLGGPKTGLDAAQLIRSVGIDKPIVLISGNITSSLIAKFNSYSISKFLTKDISNAEILAAIQEVLEVQESGKEKKEVSSFIRQYPKQIVAIDGNNQSLHLYRLMFEKEYDVRLCKNAKEMMMLKGESVDLVLMDYRIEGEEFKSVLDKVKELFPYAQRVLVTGAVNFEEVVAKFKNEFISFIPKPIDTVKFHQYINQLLDQKVACHGNSHIINF